MGKVTREDGWHLKDAQLTKRLLRTRGFSSFFDQLLSGYDQGQSLPELSSETLESFRKLVDSWKQLKDSDVRLALRQKGVDMRIGIDIATIALKKQADTIILITGDSDFVPAAKVARREGVEFLLDPLWQSINDDLHEHVDGVVSAFRKTTSGKANLIDTEDGC